MQVDISPIEIDSNRAIAAPVIGDIRSVVAAFNTELKSGRVKVNSAWRNQIAKRKQKNAERMAARLNADPNPMNFRSALRAVRTALADRPDVYIVNEGAIRSTSAATSSTCTNRGIASTAARGV